MSTSSCPLSRILVWLDGSTGNSSENEAADDALKRIHTNYKRCSNETDFIDFCKSSSDSTKIILVVSGQLGQAIIPKIHNENNIANIYIYCYNIERYINLTEQYHKITAVLNDFRHLIAALKNSLQPSGSIVVNITASSSDCTDHSGSASPSSGNKVEVATSADHSGSASPSSGNKVEVATSADHSGSASPSSGNKMEVTTSADHSGSASSDNKVDVTTTADQSGSPSSGNKVEVAISADHPDSSQSGSNTLNIQTSDESMNSSCERLFKINSTYAILEVVFSTIQRLPHINENIGDFFNLCETSSNDTNINAISRELKQNYPKHLPIELFYKHSFFHTYLDNTYKHFNIEAMYLCQTYIQDIWKYFKENKCKSKIDAYSVVSLSNEYLQALKTFKGQATVMKLFLYANRQVEQAKLYINWINYDMENKKVIFHINADPNVENAKPFICLDNSNTDITSAEVWFMIGSIFKIDEIEDEQDGYTTIKMTLSGVSSDNEVVKPYEEIKRNYMANNDQIEILKWIKMINELGMHDNNTVKLWQLQQILNLIIERTKEVSDKIPYYEYLVTLQLQSNDITSCTESLVKLYKLKSENETFDDVLDYFSEFCKKSKENYIDRLILCYKSFIDYFRTEKQINHAQACYYRLLSIAITNKPNDYALHAEIYSNLSQLYIGTETNEFALGCLKQSLSLATKAYTKPNESLARTYGDIGFIYEFMNEKEKCQENLEKAKQIWEDLSLTDKAYLEKINQSLKKLTT